MDKKSEVYNFYLRSKGGWGVILGRSMEPFLEGGWKVKIEPINGEKKIKVGDIAIFGQDILTCHRIIRKLNFFGQTYFIHKGDNTFIGGIFESKDLVGRVVEVFGENSQSIDKKMWQRNSCKNRKVLAYIYLFMYLLKKFIWKGKTNWLSCSVNRFFWNLIAKFVL